MAGAYQSPPAHPRGSSLCGAALISTRCPQCGGDLSFEEGSNAIRCPFCGIALLVTGYGRVLSYYLPAARGEEEVKRQALQTAQARTVASKASLQELLLAFVPYYRITGLDFSWSWEYREISSPLLSDPDRHLPLGRGGQDLDLYPGEGFGPLREKEYRLACKYLDRTFLAADLPRLTLTSLSFRPQVLALRLFDWGEIRRQGTVIPVAMESQDAWRQAEKWLPAGNLTLRRLINRTLSLVFFPLWEARIEADGRHFSLLIDAVSGSPLSTLLLPPLLPSSPGSQSSSLEILRFRPLLCPNCGADLPPEPSFRLFTCASCHRVWKIHYESLLEVSYLLAHPPKGMPSPSRCHFLPFWTFQAQVHLDGRILTSKHDLAQIAPLARVPREEEKGIPLLFFVPAFKVRDLLVLNRIATSFTRLQPAFEVQPYNGEDLHPGCILDREEAANFAPLTLISLLPRGNSALIEAAARAELLLSPGRLLFFPFREELNYWREDFLGTAISKNTLG